MPPELPLDTVEPGAFGNGPYQRSNHLLQPSIQINPSTELPVFRGLSSLGPPFMSESISQSRGVVPM